MTDTVNIGILVEILEALPEFGIVYKWHWEVAADNEIVDNGISQHDLARVVPRIGRSTLYMHSILRDKILHGWKKKQSCCDMSISIPRRNSTPFCRFPICCCDPLWLYSVSLVFSTCCRTAHTRPLNQTDAFCKLSVTRHTVNHMATLVSTAADVSASHWQPVRHFHWQTWEWSVNKVQQLV